MSGRVVGRVFERRIGSASRKAVLLCLAEHANPDGEMAFPSVARIAQETELGESTVRESLAWLRSERLITQTRRPGHHRPATYAVNLDRLEDLQLVEVYKEADLQRAAPDLQQAASDLQLLESRPPTAGPEPSLNPSEEPSEEETQPSALRLSVFADGRIRTGRLHSRLSSQILTRRAPPEALDTGEHERLG